MSSLFDEVCADGSTPADYHDTITGEKFIAWIQNRLLPTFKALFHTKRKKPRMILVLDNAKYHHHRGLEWYTPSKMNRGQLADFLRQSGFKSITDKNDRVIPASKFSADAGNGGPTLAAMREVASSYLKSHPDINTTVPHQLLSAMNYSLIYTPPYES